MDYLPAGTHAEQAKKLIALARALATQSPKKRGEQEQRLGIRGSVAARLEQHQASSQKQRQLSVYPENADAWDLFFSLQTQWTVAAGMGGIAHIGIPLPCVESELRLRGVPRRRWRDLADDVRIMERAYLAARAEHAAIRAGGKP